MTADLRILWAAVWRRQHLARLRRTPQFHAAMEWAASYQPRSEDVLTLDDFNGRFGSR